MRAVDAIDRIVHSERSATPQRPALHRLQEVCAGYGGRPEADRRFREVLRWPQQVTAAAGPGEQSAHDLSGDAQGFLDALAALQQARVASEYAPLLGHA